MIKDKDELTPEERLMLEEAWLQAARVHFRAGDTHYVQILFAEHTNTKDPVDVIRQFYLCIKKGITPPANILKAIAESFESYVKSDGNESLDTFFGHIKKQGRKDPLKQKIKDEIKWRVYSYMWMAIKEAEFRGSTLAIYAAAGFAIDRFGLKKTKDSLEKEYIASKADQLFTKINSSINDENAERLLKAL